MTEMNNKLIGLRITQARKAAGLKKVDLANKIQVAASTIGRYEDGTILKVSIPVIQAIAVACNVNPMWLVGKSEYMKTEEMLNAMSEGLPSSQQHSDPDKVVNIQVKNPQIVRLARLATDLSKEDLNTLVSLTESLAKKKGNRKGSGVDEDI